MPAALEALHAIVVRTTLPCGDYQTGSETLVERKTVRGLHRALIEGRLFRQLHALRLACASP